jgi:zinc/manganese transport system substrate-binding protein
MRRLSLLLILLLLALPAQAKLRVFACEPEWGALTKELAGDRAEVFVATTAQQDPHYIQARPALISQLRRAELAVCTGAELEIGWLPMLKRRANNPRVLEGAPGYLEAASVVPLLEKPERIDRAEGDIHASGNPHIQLDPHNIARVAHALSERLIALDKGNAEHYRTRAADFQLRWQRAIQGWEARAAPLRGMPIVVAHTSWAYLEQWLGLERVAALEPKPGVPPSSGHLAQVLAQTKARDARAALYAAYQDGRSARWLAERSPVKAVELPYTVGGTPRADDLFSLFDDTIDRLLEARR